MHSDLDLSTGVALLSDGQVIVAGKARIVFLLNGADLGGVGGQQAEIAHACGDDIDGGVAVVGSTVYLPCLSGPIAVQASDSPPGLRLLWRSSVGGGPPIVAGGLVWTIGSNGVLYGLNPSTGTVTAQSTIGTPANHFPTPSIGAGLLLAPSSDPRRGFLCVDGDSLSDHNNDDLPAHDGNVRRLRPDNRRTQSLGHRCSRPRRSRRPRSSGLAVPPTSEG